jgi:hypothetical protein
MKMTFDWVINRLGESSTWRGIIGILTGAGVMLDEKQAAAIVAAGLAAIGLINVFRKQPESADANTATNTPTKVIGFLFIVGLSAILISGCGTVDRVLLVQNVTPAVTNAVTGEVTPPLTNVAIAPKVTATIETGKAYAAAAPPPWGWIASGVLTLLSGGLGIYVKSKNGKLKTSQSMLNAVVAGVEAAGDSAGEVKISIQKAAAAAGVQEQLDPLVQKVSSLIK